MEPQAGRRAEEDPGKKNEEGAVDREAARVMDADRSVEGDPGEGEPARPVVSEEQKDADHGGQEFGDLDPPGVRLTGEQAAEVGGKTHHADRQIQAGQQRDGKRAPTHMQYRIQGIACSV
jgi:hypothetical protein